VRPLLWARYISLIIHYIQLTVADKTRDFLRVNPNMIQGTSNDKLEQLKEDLQRARAEQETHRAIRRAEIDAEKQARADAARGRHQDMMSQLRAMRELLHDQRESQAQRVEQMDQRHAEQVRGHESTARQMSDIQATLTLLHDEQRARSEQHAEEHTLAKAGGYPQFPMDVNFQMMRFDSKDIEASKKVSESVAETRNELLSIAGGMTISYLTMSESNLMTAKQNCKTNRLADTRNYDIFCWRMHPRGRVCP
jgi:hypothetical protein